MDQFQGHWHLLGNENGIDSSALGSGEVGGSINRSMPDSTQNRYIINRALNAVSDGTNGEPRYGEETRVKNISIKLWQRIN